jgi:heptose I phosphotransferase
VKDIGGLYYSALDIGLTRRDVLRFVRTYGGRPLRELLGRDAVFWRAAARRAGQIYQRDHGRAPASTAWFGR